MTKITNEELARRISVLDTKLEERDKLIMAQLAPLAGLQKEVRDHGKQISFWRGALSLLYIILGGCAAFLGLKYEH